MSCFILVVQLKTFQHLSIMWRYLEIPLCYCFLCWDERMSWKDKGKMEGRGNEDETGRERKGKERGDTHIHTQESESERALFVLLF